MPRLPIAFIAGSIIAGSLVIFGCANKDGAKPDTVETADKSTAAADPKSTDTAQPSQLKGLDPAPALSRMDMGNGLVIEDLKIGAGDTVWPNGMAKLQIKGWSVVTGKKYWDTAEVGGPKEINLAKAMKGLQEGVPGMRVGGKRRLHIGPDKAYGFREVKDENGVVVVPQLTPIVLEIEAIESLSKLKTTSESGGLEQSAPSTPQK